MCGPLKKRRTAGASVRVLGAMFVLAHPPPAGAIQAAGGEAAPDPISAERPNNQSTDPIAKGIFQLELGYVFERDNSQEHGVSIHTIPDLLLIVGLTDRVDLRVMATGYVRRQVTGDTTGQRSVDGSGDLTIASLIGLIDQVGGLPTISILPSVTLPTGTRELTDGGIGPGMTLAASWTALDRFGITWNAAWRSVIAASTDAERQDEFETTLNLEVGLAKSLDFWTMYLAEYSSDVQGIGQGVVFGFSYRLSDDSTVNGSAGFGVSGSTSDFIGSVGMAVRWPLFR